jgi:hypothetical protein
MLSFARHIQVYWVACERDHRKAGNDGALLRINQKERRVTVKGFSART